MNHLDCKRRLNASQPFGFPLLSLEPSLCTGSSTQKTGRLFCCFGLFLVRVRCSLLLQSHTLQHWRILHRWVPLLEAVTFSNDSQKSTTYSSIKPVHSPQENHPLEKSSLRKVVAEMLRLDLLRGLKRAPRTRMLKHFGSSPTNNRSTLPKSPTSKTSTPEYRLRKTRMRS